MGDFSIKSWIVIQIETQQVSLPQYNQIIFILQWRSQHKLQALLRLIVLQTIWKLLDAFLPVIIISKRKQNLKLKPWITTVLTTSVKIRGNIYKNVCKAKEPNLKKNQLQEKYKICGNQYSQAWIRRPLWDYSEVFVLGRRSF